MQFVFNTRCSVDVFPQEGDVVLAALVGGLADDRRVGGLHHGNEQVGVDLAGAEVGVPVGARARGVPRVVAVHQVDAAGEGLDAVDRVDQRLPAAQAWQVSRQKPMPVSPMWSHSRAMVSK